MKNNFPKTIDINPTAKCNLKCEFCWGPNVSIGDELSLKQWIEIIDYFADRGTKSVILTGGEPLMYKHIVALIDYLESKKLRITLSTNSILLGLFKKDILPKIDDIGIPLDGSDSLRNSRMRFGELCHFNKVLESLNYIKNENKNLSVTVRTVLSKRNLDDLSSIGKILEKNKSKFDRWKIYQFSPFGRGFENKDKFFISNNNFLKLARDIKKLYPALSIETSLWKDGIGRYLFINPQGDIYGVSDFSGKYNNCSNFFKLKKDALETEIKKIFFYKNNNKHGK
jgi:MoaA/NifB/PqqE/SkfB family radical SAM enzyme